MRPMRIGRPRQSSELMNRAYSFALSVQNQGPRAQPVIVPVDTLNWINDFFPIKKFGNFKIGGPKRTMSYLKQNISATPSSLTMMSSISEDFGSLPRPARTLATPSSARSRDRNLRLPPKAARLRNVSKTWTKIFRRSRRNVVCLPITKTLSRLD